MVCPRARRLIRAAGFLLALAAAGAPAAAQETGPPLEVLLELRLRNGPRNIVIALARDSIVFAPLGQFLDLAGVAISEVVRGRRVAGRIEPDGIRFWFDLAGGEVMGAAGLQPLDSADAVWQGQELYVTTAVLDAVFDVDFSMDWGSLVLSVERTDHLPVLERAARARRRRRLLGALETPSPSLIPTPRPAADGAVLDWAVTSTLEAPEQATSVQLGLGAQLGGGSLTVEHLAQITTGPDQHQTTASWIKAWPDARWVRQVRLGDVPTEGLRPRTVRGAVFTNVPFLRDAAFTTEQLRGAYGPGWEVELYRGERLVGFTTTSDAGVYDLTVPVQYGPNPFRTVAYGPHGEVVQDQLTFDIPFRRLPARSLEYALGGGECRADPCTGFLNADLRAGLTDRVTVEGGLDAFLRDTLPELWHPYLVVSGAVTRSISLTAEGVLNGLLRGRVDLSPSPDFRLAVAHTRFDGSVRGPILSQTGVRHATDASLFWRPGLLHNRIFFQGTAARTAGGLGTTDVVRISGTTRLAGIRTVLTVREEGFRPAGEDVRSSRLRIIGSANRTLVGPAALRGILVQGAVGVEPSVGMSILAAGVGRRFYDALRVDIGGGWERGRGGFLELNITTLLPYLRSNSRAIVSGAGTTDVQFVEGSVLWDSRNDRVRFGNGRSLGRAGMSGEVFLDENGNGRKEPGELPLGGVNLRVGANTLRTDSLGRFTLWDIVPFQGTDLQIDTLSLQNPLWVPAAVHSRIIAGPNAFQQVPIAVMPGGEMAGTVRRADGRPAGGIRVAFVHLETGESTETLTFADGAFYVMGLRPGRWRVSVDPDQLERLGLTAEPVEARLRFSVGGAIFEGIVLELRRP